LVLKQLAESGAIKATEQHSKQGLFTPIAVAADKAPVAVVAEKEAGKTKAPKKEKK
jgi:hypothetical protein